MFKSRLLSSAVYFDAEKEGGSGGGSDKAKIEKDKVREGIKTTNSDDNSGKEDNKSDDDKKDNKESDEEREDGDKESDEDDKDEKDEDGEKEEKELTDEQKEIEALKKKVSRLEKRTGRTAGERDQFKKELAAAKTQLEAKVEAGEGLTEEEVERRSDIKAEQKVVQREYDRAVAKLIKDAVKVDKDFNSKASEMAAEVAPITPFMIGALEDIDNGGAVLAYLADNVDEYEEIFGLSPAKVVSRLNKISEKLIDAAKEKPKKISKMPDPPAKDLRGNQSNSNVLNPKNMEEYTRVRMQQKEERRKARLR